MALGSKNTALRKFFSDRLPTLRSQCVDNSSTVGTTCYRRAIELATLGYQIADRDLTVGAAGAGIERRLRPVAA